VLFHFIRFIGLLGVHYTATEMDLNAAVAMLNKDRVKDYQDLQESSKESFSKSGKGM
jgi:hypothetical protein